MIYLPEIFQHIICMDGVLVGQMEIGPGYGTDSEQNVCNWPNTTLRNSKLKQIKALLRRESRVYLFLEIL